MKIKTLLTYPLALMFVIGMAACGGGQSGGGSSENGESGEMKEKKEDHDHSEGEGKEHPDEGGKEHPDEGGEEHPDEGGEEHPDDKKQSSNLTIEQFADAAKNHIQKAAKKNDGYFHVKDKKQGKTLKLELEKVHRKRLSHLGDNKYFVCADFKGKDGKTYDVDIFMKGTKKSNLEEVRAPKVHKVEGEPRFTYHKVDGTWEQKPVKQKASS